MGSLLATVFLAVPLITWLGGLILLTDSQWKVARPHHAPCGIFPNYRNSNSCAAAAHSNLHPAAARWTR